MKNRTLVKSKIVLEDDGRGLVIYLWKKTFWIFGYWYPFGCSSGISKFPKERIDKINDNAISAVLFDNFVSASLSTQRSPTQEKLMLLKKNIHRTSGHTFAAFGSFHIGKTARASEYADMTRASHLECAKLIDELIEEAK